ncbi:Predicted protein [Halarsenatibacter silvermanii]|uniref:Phosphodiester glycosidase domain-containing protein n=1 Tax=Halarsenatibacter silvermanii TaxID=321763 RepID=A0A1G9TG41_9FIRM|nr:Predicted protein [Halarsenatibacter silvermanii]
MMLGITAEGELGIIAVEGRSLAVDSAGNCDGMSTEIGMSAGATLSELAELARKQGYYYALNLDGGGSANLLYAGEPLIERAALMGQEYVTHDQEETMSLSDRVVVMNQGEIKQIGTPK